MSRLWCWYSNDVHHFPAQILVLCIRRNTLWRYLFFSSFLVSGLFIEIAMKNATFGCCFSSFSKSLSNRNLKYSKSFESFMGKINDDDQMVIRTIKTTSHQQLRSLWSFSNLAHCYCSALLCFMNVEISVICYDGQNSILHFQWHS